MDMHERKNISYSGSNLKSLIPNLVQKRHLRFDKCVRNCYVSNGGIEKMPCDWTEVVAMEPKGYVELNDGQRILIGPIESMWITPGDNVEIKLRWTARVKLDPSTGVPDGEFEAVPNEAILFPNIAVPYVLENEPGLKGLRIQFGRNLLFLRESELDTSRIRGFPYRERRAPGTFRRLWHQLRRL
jgi:hypothetical protein